MNKVSGLKLFKQFDADEPIVSMTEFDGTIFIATSWRVFMLVDGFFKQLVFQSAEIE